ncbi:MAG: oligosaccharide flippase family protein [Kofleriaceae bacterium]
MDRVGRSTAWVGAASGMLGVLDLVSTLLCIRLWVTTADFGEATLAIALFPILDRLGGMGFGAVLVREPGGAAKPRLEHTVFWLNACAAASVLVVALAVYAATGALVVALIVAYAVRLVIQTGSVVPEARLRRALRFGELSVIRVIAGAAEFAAKLGLAYLGAHGRPELRVWCFAIGPVVNTALTTLALQLRCAWRPRLAFDRTAARKALGFTAALSGGELLYFAYTSADYLVIGAAFGTAAVGVYRLAYELVLDVVRLISMITAEIAYPVFVQTPRDALAGQFLRFSRQNVYVLVPFLGFVAVGGGWLLRLLYGPLPAEAAVAARVLCVVGALRALGFVIPPLLAALGHTSRVLVYNAVAAIVLPVAFVIAAWRGNDFTAVAWAWAIGYPIAFALLLAFALAALPLSLGRYVRGLSPWASTTRAAPAPGTTPPPST